MIHISSETTTVSQPDEIAFSLCTKNIRIHCKAITDNTKPVLLNINTRHRHRKILAYLSYYARFVKNKNNRIPGYIPLERVIVILTCLFEAKTDILPYSKQSWPLSELVNTNKNDLHIYFKISLYDDSTCEPWWFIKSTLDQRIRHVNPCRVS